MSCDHSPWYIKMYMYYVTDNKWLICMKLCQKTDTVKLYPLEFFFNPQLL